MTYFTQKEAKQTKCPVARTFDDGKSATCDGDKCLLWRWRDLPANDHRVLGAYARVQQDLRLPVESGGDVPHGASAARAAGLAALEWLETAPP